MDGIGVKGVNFKSKRRYKCEFDPKFVKTHKWKIGGLPDHWNLDLEFFKPKIFYLNLISKM
jgi:hypothetical protein